MASYAVRVLADGLSETRRADLRMVASRMKEGALGVYASREWPKRRAMWLHSRGLLEARPKEICRGGKIRVRNRYSLNSLARAVLQAMAEKKP